LFPRFFVKLDGIAIGMIDQDLLATRPDLDLVPAARRRLCQRGDGVVDAVDVQNDSIPSAGLLAPTVGHRPGAGAGRAAEQVMKVAARHDSERPDHCVTWNRRCRV
jgi:hypothetical protein